MKLIILDFIKIKTIKKSKGDVYEAIRLTFAFSNELTLIHVGDSSEKNKKFNDVLYEK